MTRIPSTLLLLLLWPAWALALGRYDARNGDECRAQVNANLGAMNARSRAEYLHDCNQLERRQQDSRMSIAYRRLGEVMDTLIAGAKPSAEALQAVDEEAKAIHDFKPAPYRDAYLQRHAEYLRLVEQGPTAAQRNAPWLSPPPAPPIPNPDLAAPPEAVGRLRPWGDYFRAEIGQTVSVLADGSVLRLGHSRPRPDADNPAVNSTSLRGRRDASYSSVVELSPRLWDPERRGWLRLPDVPECPRGQRYLHTASVLPDEKVLFAGGLCDMTKMGTDRTPYAAFAAMSLWDAKARRWLAAPALNEPRLGHTASVLADGSVLFVGGESDPALATTTTGEPVLASAERYEQGRVSPVPPLAAARAGHTATVLADGSVLVVGGFDAEGRALRSAERWAPGDAAWREVPGAHFARHGHTATRLADGRVLVAGGVGIDGQRLTAVELWDPRAQEWRAAPSLAVPLSGHAATLLADGRVLLAGGARMAAIGAVPWAWIWGPGEGEWRIAGHIENNTVRRHADTVTLVPRSDGGALMFTGLTIMRWDPRLLPAEETPPLWQSAPAAARLADGRVLFVGAGPAEQGNTRSAYLWDPARNRWQAAGRPSGGVIMRAGMVVLPSGRLLHVGLDSDGRFACDTWDARSDRWSSCGSAALEYVSELDVQPGLLADGRAVVLVNRHEALVFDEPRNGWATWKPEWNTAGLTFGAPIRSDEPLARVQDPASARWFEINDLGARLWQQQTTAVKLYWDAQAQQWAYVLQHTMGHDARRLPDGCVLSVNPLALFDPATGKAAALVDPGLGVSLGQRTLLVLPDGTAVVAGVPPFARDPGSGFFHRKVGCNGFESDADDVGYIAGGLAVDAPAPAAGPAMTAAPHVPWPRQAADWIAEQRWLLLAIGAPLIGWALLRRTRLKRVQVGPSWALRALIYGAALIWLVPAAWSYRNFSVARNAEDCMDDAACALRSAAAHGIIPCQLVGVWSSRQGSAMRRIELKDDGTYVMAAREGGGDPVGGYQGRWIVEGQNIVWRHARASELDINPMHADGPGRFTLVEMNGTRTQYELIRAVASSRCTS